MYGSPSACSSSPATSPGRPRRPTHSPVTHDHRARPRRTRTCQRANDYDGLPSSSSSSSTPSASSKSTPPSSASKARAASTYTMISERSSCPRTQRRRSTPRQPYRYPTGGSPRFAGLPRYRRPASGRPTASGPALRLEDPAQPRPRSVYAQRVTATLTPQVVRLGPGRRHAHSFLRASRIMSRVPPRSWRGVRRSFRPRAPPVTCRPSSA
jgi:hypothetical protein